VGTKPLAGLLRDASPNIGELKEIVAEIRHHEQRATEVIKRLRRLFRKETAELEEFDLDEAFNGGIRASCSPGCGRPHHVKR
jgi:hypothetical protein